MLPTKWGYFKNNKYLERVKVFILSSGARRHLKATKRKHSVKADLSLKGGL